MPFTGYMKNSNNKLSWLFFLNSIISRPKMGVTIHPHSRNWSGDMKLQGMADYFMGCCWANRIPHDPQICHSLVTWMSNRIPYYGIIWHYCFSLISILANQKRGSYYTLNPDTRVGTLEVQATTNRFMRRCRANRIPCDPQIGHSLVTWMSNRIP